MKTSITKIIAFALLASVTVGSVQVAHAIPDKKKLLNAYVSDYKNVNAQLQQARARKQRAKMMQLKRRRRQIIRRVALAGLTAAFLGAIGAAAVLIYKGKRVNPKTAPPEVVAEAAEQAVAKTADPVGEPQPPVTSKGESPVYEVQPHPGDPRFMEEVEAISLEEQMYQ